jgi:kinesin family protein 2/24
MKPISKPPVKASEGIVKKNTLAEIQKLQKDRDERRKNMEQIKLERIAEEQRNRENGTPGDVDFQRMIRQYREQASQERTHLSTNDKICICVRKRPLSVKEVKRLDYDSVTCINPVIAVHDCKLKVDGISKYLDNNLFEMDHAFHEDNTTEDIYYAAIEPLVDFVLDSGRATVFAYVIQIFITILIVVLIAIFKIYRVKQEVVKRTQCKVKEKNDLMFI